METRPLEWEGKIEGESDADFAKYLLFIGLGPARSVAQAEAVGTGRPQKASASGNWKRVSVANRWLERVAAFDLMVAKKVATDMVDRRQAFTDAYLKSLLHAVDMINSCFEDGDLEKFRKMAPRVLMMLGKGRIGDYVANGQKGLFGEKHQVAAMVRVEFDIPKKNAL